MPIYTPGKLTLAKTFTLKAHMWQFPSLYGLPNIGDALEGGYLAGLISYTADSQPTHALIVAPRATGATGSGYTLTTNRKWADQTVGNPAHGTLIGASSNFDGKANTDLMMSLIADSTYSAGAFPAAQFCADLSIGGYTDWYLPARYELDIAYFNLKPDGQFNFTSWGSNVYSVPRRDLNNTATYPAQTALTAFNTYNTEAFVAEYHWSSTEFSASNGWGLFFNVGLQTGAGPKESSERLRAFRRIALP